MIGLQDSILPKRKTAVPLPPSYIFFDGAFGLGTGAKLGDKSRYRSHGTISGADWATGVHGKCLDFVCTVPDYVEIAAAHDQLDFTSEDFSIIARIKVDDITAMRMIFSRGSWKADGYHFFIDTVGKLGLGTFQSGAAQYSRSSNGSIATATWYTMGMSRDGASVKFYVDGVEDTATAGTHVDPATSARKAGIGIHSNLVSNPFDGKIEFFRIFGGIALLASTHLAYHNALA